MKLMLLHLSDIHVSGDTDTITERHTQIADAVKNLDYTLDFCLIVITGDIAFSGNQDQYLIALEFLDKLQQHLSTSLSTPGDRRPIDVHIIAVPGNHDNDFTATGQVRDILVNSVLEDYSQSQDFDVVAASTQGQEHFFDFLTAIETQPRESSTDNYDIRLCYSYTLQHENESLKLICCNTAWLSQIHEAQGKLYFPHDAISDHQDDVDLAIAAFHHPYNWMEANSARSFRDRIESVADLILTGHEHVASQKVQEASNGIHNICVEGGVLQDSQNPNLSEFNVFIFDTAQTQMKFGHFQWANGSYALTDKSYLGDDGGGLRWYNYRSNPFRKISQFRLSAAMRERLDDPGITLHHSHRGLLKLSDVFLYPDLIEMKTRGQRYGQRLNADALASLLKDNPKMLITGDSVSGKTSLSKRLYQDLLENRIIPVLIDGSIKPPTGDRALGYAEQLFAEQYNPGLLSTYQQLDKSSRAIIIDDYEKLPVSSTRKRQFLSTLASSVRYLIVFSHEMAADLDELTNPGILTDYSHQLTHFRIQPFGHAGRNRIVERWMLLGDDVEPRGSDFIRHLARTTETLNTLVGKNYIPSYPLYVLSVLQAFDTATPIDITASTHGYFYELFIRTSLARGRTSVDFDVIASYLAYVAFQMRARNVTVITDRDFKAIHSSYEKQYDIRRPYETLKRHLLSQNILAQIDDGLQFKYNYLYNYFVASYLRDHISEPTIRQLIRDMSRTLYIESNANMLLFLAHLCKDPIVVEELLAASQELYATHSPAQLKDDIIFLAEMEPVLAAPAYEESDPRSNREHMLTVMDRHAPPESGLMEVNSAGEDIGIDRNDPIVQFVIALRHLEILGQVLKNFPGSLDATTKLSIGRECFNLGLRSLTVVLDIIRSDQKELLHQFAAAIKDQRSELSMLELENLAKETLTSLMDVLSYGMIKRISKAVSSRELTNTYERLLKESETPAVKLITSALELDNDDEFPANSIRFMAEEFEKTPLPLSVLRYLVVSHFHLFPVHFRTKQSICAELGIKYSSLHRSSPVPRMLPSGS